MMEKYGVERSNFPIEKKEKKKAILLDENIEKTSADKNPAVKVFEEIDEATK